MIDAGLPLVQCLDILGNQEEDKNFARVILQMRADVEAGLSLADAMKRHPKTFDALFTQHDRGRRGGRHPRHHPQAAGGLHREERQAEGAGEVGDDLPGRRHRHRGAGRRRHPVEGHPDLRRAVRGPRRRPAAADARRHLGEQRARPLHADLHRRRSSALAFGFRQYYATDKGRRVIDGLVLRAPILGLILRKIAVARFCRTLSTLISSGVPILDGLDITARTAGNAIVEDARPGHAQEHRARRDRLGAAQGDQGLPGDGDADDRRRRGDRRARHDARARSPTSTRRKSTPPSPAC